MIMMKTRSDKAPPAPPSPAFSLRISYTIGINPETTLTTPKLIALFDCNAVYIARPLRPTIAVPKGYETS